MCQEFFYHLAAEDFTPEVGASLQWWRKMCEEWEFDEWWEKIGDVVVCDQKALAFLQSGLLDISGFEHFDDISLLFNFQCLESCKFLVSPSPRLISEEVLFGVGRRYCEGWNAFRIACANGYLAICELLLASFPEEIINAKNDAGG